MIKAGTIVRWGVRLAMLGAAVALLWGGPVPGLLAEKLRWLGAAVGIEFSDKLPSELSRVIPGLSPLVGAASSAALRRWYLAWFWLAPPAVVLLAAIWKGRLFCRWVCPAGTIYAIPARLSLKKRILKARLSAYLFWTIVFASAVGAPLVLFLDPLSTFNRFGPVVRGTYTIASLVPGLLLPLFLVLGFVQPMIWCAHICPLGYFLEFSRSVRRRPRQAFSRARRGLLGGLAAGVPLALVTRLFLLAKDKDAYESAPVLPPGAKDLQTFAAACTRCYACVEVCPTKIIRVGFDLDRAVGQLFQPELVYFDSEKQPGFGYCAEPCNECSGVCAAGALTRLSFEDKWHRQIGVAKVIPEACLSWELGEDCMICQEVCPYFAIDADYSDQDVARPVVNEDACRGCGSCHSKCPAIDKGKAIIVEGVAEQKQLPPEEGIGPELAQPDEFGGHSV